METMKRTVAKAVTWQIAGLIAMTLIGYLMTGSWRAGGGIAVAGMISGFICYFLHERIWALVSWGRKQTA